MVIKSLLLAIFKSIFLCQQKAPKITAAKKQRHQIVTGGGMEIYLPKTPEVLTSSTAMFNSVICFRCCFFKY